MRENGWSIEDFIREFGKIIYEVRKCLIWRQL